jgi:hypothetical protein
VLSTPAYLMAGPSGYKWLHKTAVASLLSREWINREKRGNLSPLWVKQFNARSSEIEARLRESAPQLQRFTRQVHDGTTSNADCFRLTLLVQLASWLKDR